MDRKLAMDDAPQNFGWILLLTKVPKIHPIWYSHPSLNRKSFCPKTLSGIRGDPPPLTEKICQVVFDCFPKTSTTKEKDLIIHELCISSENVVYKRIPARL